MLPALYIEKPLQLPLDENEVLRCYGASSELKSAPKLHKLVGAGHREGWSTSSFVIHSVAKFMQPCSKEYERLRAEKEGKLELIIMSQARQYPASTEGRPYQATLISKINPHKAQEGQREESSPISTPSSPKQTKSLYVETLGSRKRLSEQPVMTEYQKVR